MILAPINDEVCLGAASRRAVEWSALPSVSEWVRANGGITGAALEMRLRPQQDHDGRACEGGVFCPLPSPVFQRLRLHALDPDCYERATEWTAGAHAMAPWLPVRLGTVELIGGQLHTMPYVPVGDVWFPVDLSPRSGAMLPLSVRGADVAGAMMLRGADWEEVKKYLKPIVGVSHAIGSIVLSAFGAGGAAPLVGKFWESLGLLDAPTGGDGGSNPLGALGSLFGGK